jgi:hypothetical protein
MALTRKSTQLRRSRKGGKITTVHTPEVLLQLLNSATKKELNAIAKIWDINLSPLLDDKTKPALVFNHMQQNTPYIKLVNMLFSSNLLNLSTTSALAASVFMDQIHDTTRQALMLFSTLGPLIFAVGTKIGMSLVDKQRSNATTMILNRISVRLLKKKKI